jgi:endonuclease/exonuclease/phosphatase (EEP) superfamily protein YafD
MQTFAWVLLVLVVVTTAASLLNKQRWWVRMFDLPRAQMIVLGVVAMVLFAVNGNWGTPELVALTLLFISLIYQARKVYPYTPFAPVMSKRAEPRADADRLTLIAANVLGTNRDAGAFLRIVEQHDPDLVLTLESDAWWENALEPLERSRPHAIKIPLDNLYGMHLFSRFPLTNTEVRYLVEDDVPSIRTTVVLPSGAKVTVHGVHPRPPAPGENDTAKERDAELLLVAREIEAEPCTTIVAGDLNDVAWSTTSDLFRKTSGLLDPRRGRGFFNTFHAKIPFFRWPLDHIFHSTDLALLDLVRLPQFGSDHYPMFIALEHRPHADNGDAPEPPTADEEEEVEEKIEEGKAHAGQG